MHQRVAGLAELLRGSFGADVPFAHDRDAVGETGGGEQGDIMGDHEQRDRGTLDPAGGIVPG